MTGKEELLEQLRIMNELANANICRMNDNSLRMIAHGLKTLVSKEFTTRLSREDVARYLGVSTRTLERYQANYKDFPQPKHYGTKEVSFDCEEVVKWKNNHRWLFE